MATLWQSEGVPADHAVSHGALVRRCSPRQLAVQSAAHCPSPPSRDITSCSAPSLYSPSPPPSIKWQCCKALQQPLTALLFPASLPPLCPACAGPACCLQCWESSGRCPTACWLTVSLACRKRSAKQCHRATVTPVAPNHAQQHARQGALQVHSGSSTAAMPDITHAHAHSTGHGCTGIQRLQVLG